MQQFYRNGRLIEWDPEKPVITCLMSVYNGETYLREAMDSILDQTYTNFEFLIINDGSTDGTVPIIESYDDPRIRLVHNKENIGLTKSLNKGIDLAKGEYIARMDADDISLPERFKRQLDCLLLNQEIIGCGSNAIVIDEFGKQIDVVKKPIKWQDCGRFLVYNNSFIHSSVTIHKEVLKSHKYNNDLKYAQDYDLFLRLVANDFKLSNIEDYLVKHREHSKSLEYNYSKEQNIIVKESFNRQFNVFKSNITCAILSYDKVDQTVACISKILKNNVKVNIWDNNSSRITKFILNRYIKKMNNVICNWSDKNIGVARARNEQIKQIKSKYILFLDNDIQISEHFFFKLFKEYLESTDADGWMIKLFNQHHKSYQAHYEIITENKSNQNDFKKRVIKSKSYSNMFTGGAVLIKKSIFENRGMYDSNMFVGLEDYDFAIQQIQKANPLRIYCLAETEALHAHLPPLFKRDIQSIKERYDRTYNENSLKLINKKNNIQLVESVQEYIENSLNHFKEEKKFIFRRYVALIYRILFS